MRLPAWPSSTINSPRRVHQTSNCFSLLARGLARRNLQVVPGEWTLGKRHLELYNEVEHISRCGPVKPCRRHPHSPRSVQPPCAALARLLLIKRKSSGP